jgi:hypothetical protein
MSGVSGLTMLFGWVRLFVVHFLAKRNLEVYTDQLAKVGLNHRPDVKIFSVNSEHYKVPDWEVFEKVIRDALGDTSMEDATKIIESLRLRVITGKGMNGQAVASLRWFKAMVEKKEEMTLSLYMHCEAVVAALLAYKPDLESVESDPLAKLSQVLGFVPECEIFH